MSCETIIRKEQFEGSQYYLLQNEIEPGTIFTPSAPPMNFDVNKGEGEIKLDDIKVESTNRVTKALNRLRQQFVINDVKEQFDQQFKEMCLYFYSQTLIIREEPPSEFVQKCEREDYLYKIKKIFQDTKEFVLVNTFSKRINQLKTKTLDDLNKKINSIKRKKMPLYMTDLTRIMMWINQGNNRLYFTVCFLETLDNNLEKLYENLDYAFPNKYMAFRILKALNLIED